MKDEIVRRSAGLMEAKLDGELVGLNVDQGSCYGFNATATRVWELIERPVRRSELRAALLSEFDVDDDTCDRQLGELLQDLQQHGLVEVAPLDQ